MLTKLTQSGDSYALVLERSMLDMLNINPDTLLRITTNGRTIEVTPITREITDEELKAAMDRFKQRYGSMMKRLAE